ncbi:MAG: hypothetical protein H6Q64_2157 [Firmicutes bacterium]|nr:hypothetical protein [Bacillota bacterium]
MQCRRILLVCGIFSSLLWVGGDILAAIFYDGYSYTNQAISELTAIGAPTRSFLFGVIAFCQVLVIAFGLGIWLVDSSTAAQRITSILLIVSALVQLLALVAGPFFSMNLRGAEKTVSDTIHVIFGALTVLLMLLTVGFGAQIKGQRFKQYSIMTILIIVLLGIWTGADGARIAANLPTPWMGIKERIFVYSFMLWVMVLAIVLLRTEQGQYKSSSTYRH